MKKLLVMALAITFTGLIACNSKKTEDTPAPAPAPTNVPVTGTTEGTPTTAEKEHVCTAACKDGNHVYAHGEKGHVCTEACKTAMKEHVCTDACKDGKHVYAHGEKGHTCTEACKTAPAAKTT